MRAAPLLLLLIGLAGCSPPAAVAYVATEMTSVAVLGRGLGDIVVSGVTGRDCSIVRLDAGKTYCAPRIDLPPEQPFCTRTIGVATCWADPRLAPPGQQDLAQAPPPTPDQLRYRAARWPKDLFF